MSKVLRFFLALLLPATLTAQPSMIDEVLSVVGSEIILRSEVESQVEQLVMEDMAVRGKQTFCDVLEELIMNKMLLEQARFDSIEVSKEEVEGELERRIDYFIQVVFQTKDKMEAHFGKPMEDIKDEFRNTVKEQLLMHRMRQKIIGRAKVTPSEVKDFFNSIPRDSLPYINAEVQIGQILINVPIREEERNRVIEFLKAEKAKALAGSNFRLLIRIGSDEPGADKSGGELGMRRREDFVPEFSAVAFSLKEPGEISDIVETEFGYHLVQLIERLGEYASFRHYLKVPRPYSQDIYESEEKLSQVIASIKSGKLDFAKAVEKHSDDEDSRNNGGLMMNPYSGSTTFDLDELAKYDAQTFMNVEKLRVGEFSSIHPYKGRGSQTAMRVLFLVSRTEPHVADLSLDYPKIQQMALTKKQDKLLLDWIRNAKDDFYIRLDPSCASCNFKVNWARETQ